MRCVTCSRDFDVADDDPLWSITTAMQDDGSEMIVGRHIEPPCPSCGSVAQFLPLDSDRGTATDVVDSANQMQRVNRLEDTIDPPQPFDPNVDGATQAIAIELVTP